MLCLTLQQGKGLFILNPPPKKKLANNIFFPAEVCRHSHLCLRPNFVISMSSWHLVHRHMTPPSVPCCHKKKNRKENCLHSFYPPQESRISCFMSRLHFTNCPPNFPQLVLPLQWRLPSHREGKLTRGL